jgi:hypothetical protein
MWGWPFVRSWSECRITLIEPLISLPLHFDDLL